MAEASETAKLASQAIERHEREDDRRFDSIHKSLEKIDVDLEKIDDKIDKLGRDLHSRISTMDHKYNDRWSNSMKSIIAFLCLLVVSLVGFIYMQGIESRRSLPKPPIGISQDDQVP